MSETYDTIVSKRDTRRFSDRPIPPDTLARLVQAARMAGSAKAAQPVRLVLVSDQAQKERLAACGNFTPHIPTCQVAVVFVLVPEAGVIGAPFAIFRGPFDAGRAAQNLMLVDDKTRQRGLQHHTRRRCESRRRQSPNGAGSCPRWDAVRDPSLRWREK